MALRFVVLQSNWKCEVEVGPETSRLKEDLQVMEAASRALEVFERMQAEPALTMFPEHVSEEPKLDPFMLVYRSNDHSDGAFLVLTHVCLANIGLHEKAAKMREALDAMKAKAKQSPTTSK